jgi:hypothetical protein
LSEAQINTQQACVVVTLYTCDLEMFGLNLGRTRAPLPEVVRDDNIQNNDDTSLFYNRINVSKI